MSKLNSFKNLKTLSLKSLTQNFSDAHEFKEARNFESLSKLEELNLNFYFGSTILSSFFCENIKIPFSLQIIYLSLSDFCIEKKDHKSNFNSFLKVLKSCVNLETFIFSVNSLNFEDNGYDFSKSLIKSISGLSISTLHLNLQLACEINLSKILAELFNFSKLERFIIASEKSNLSSFESGTTKYTHLKSLHLTSEFTSHAPDCIPCITNFLLATNCLNFLTFDCITEYIKLDDFRLLIQSIINLSLLEFLSFKIKVLTIDRDLIALLANYTKNSKLLRYRQINLTIKQDNHDSTYWISLFDSKKSFQFNSVVIKVENYAPLLSPYSQKTSY